MKRKSQKSLRYAAKLLFQFRVMVNGKPNKRRTCEERMVVFKAHYAEQALKMAKVYGRRARHTYKNNYGNPVHFEFVGVLDLLQLGPECEEDEVWYNITEMLKPMERKRRVLPPERKLNALYWERA